MSAQDLTLRGRARAESIMTDACTASRATGGTVTDPETGSDVPAVSVAYSGRCKVQTTVAQAGSPEAGGHAFTEENLQLHFPVSAPLRTGDSVEVTESWDSQNLGTYRLVELARGTYRTAQRWNVERVTA